MFASALTRAFAESGHRPKFVDLKNELAAVVNDPEQNLHGVRDLGKVLNAPLESNVEKLTQIVSMRRRHSKAMLQMRERRKSQADFDPMQMAAVSVMTLGLYKPCIRLLLEPVFTEIENKILCTLPKRMWTFKCFLMMVQTS